MDAIKIEGTVEISCHWEDGILAWSEHVKNNLTDNGIETLLNTFFNGGTQYPNWYIGLIDAETFEELSSADTMASHNGWSEFVGYSGDRIHWTPLFISSNTITTISPVKAVADRDGHIGGIFITSGIGKGESSGILWSSVSFSIPREVLNGQSISVLYSFRVSGGVV